MINPKSNNNFKSQVRKCGSESMHQYYSSINTVPTKISYHFIFYFSLNCYLEEVDFISCFWNEYKFPINWIPRITLFKFNKLMQYGFS
jgi:hypothetical protein